MVQRTQAQLESDAENGHLDQDGPIQNANQSARRKSARRLIELSIGDPDNEETDDEDDLMLAADILGDDGVSSDDGSSSSENATRLQPETPLKTRKPRGKKQKIKNKEPQSPPSHLPPHERYFWDNRSGANKTSDKVLPPNSLLNHDDYFAQRDAWVDPHQKERDFLLQLHQKAFHQWAFELRNEFNICLYGYGSKREVLAAFAEYLYEEVDPIPKIVIVNGFRPDISLSDILTTISSTLIPAQVKLPTGPTTLLTLILETLESKPPPSPIHILIHSMDASLLRRGTNSQTSLATLAAHPSVRLVSTADNPNFLELWDSSLRTKFRLLFHDCTTFTPLDAEIDAVESMNELLGRSGRRLGGRDGVGYVLKSLPENARHLFRILVAEQIAAAVESEDTVAGIEYRVLYQKAKEELVCTTEHHFHTLLKEFYDHQMVESRRDALGTERLLVPMRREELETLLDDLVE